MSRAPYRRPERPAEPRKRGVVVRMPEPDGEGASPEVDAREAIRLYAALEEERRARVARLSRSARITGVALVLFGVLLSWLTLGDIEAGIRTVPLHVMTLSCVGMSAGAWLALVGIGGGVPGEPDGVPRWVKIGLVVAVAIGAAWGRGHFALLQSLAAR